jgi:hypothetical protein
VKLPVFSWFSFRDPVGGTVSQPWYALEPDVFLGAPASYLAVARSVHGFWRRGRVPLQSADDGSPDYRVGLVAGQFSWLTGADSAIGVAYTWNAPHDLIARVYRVDLRCFWGIRGCDSVRQVVPLLWEDVITAPAGDVTPPIRGLNRPSAIGQRQRNLNGDLI